MSSLMKQTHKVRVTKEKLALAKITERKAY